MRFFPMQDNDFWLKLTQEALKYDVPDSEDDKEAVKADSGKAAGKSASDKKADAKKPAEKAAAENA